MPALQSPPPFTPPPAPLKIGDLVTAIYIDGRRFRAQLTQHITPHIIIQHVDADGRRVIDPPETTRLFNSETLGAVRCDDAGNPIARLEPGWPEASEVRHAA